MGYVNIHEAKTRLSQLIADIESGRAEEIIIARNGKPAVRLVALTVARPQREFGYARGKFEFDYEAFQALDAEVQAMFDESAARPLFPED